MNPEKVDKWLFFLNEALSLLEISAIMGAVPEIKKAFDIVSQENFTSINELEALKVSNL